jgi:hypothetical protein
MEIQTTVLKMVLMLSGMKMLMVILSIVALALVMRVMVAPELAMSVVMNMVARTITMVTVAFVTQK